jgi:hypothetical protein
MKMSDKYVVPDEGLKAAHSVSHRIAEHDTITAAVREFIRWQSENPLTPTPGQMCNMEREIMGAQYNKTPLGPICAIRNWMRRMYLAPAPEADPALQAVKDAIGRRIGIG